MEFIEKAASIFQGLKNDINSILIDKNVFNCLFDIVLYYQSSDMLNIIVFRLIENIIKNGRAAILDMNKSLNASQKEMIKQLSGKRKLSMHKSNISSIGANWSTTKVEQAN